MTDNKKYLDFGGRRGGGKIFALEKVILRQKQEIACLRAEVERLRDQSYLLSKISLFRNGFITEEVNDSSVKIHNIADIKAEVSKDFAKRIFDLFPDDKNYTTISRLAVMQIAKKVVGDDE